MKRPKLAIRETWQANNRLVRRAAKRSSAGISLEVAVHESGHAIGRYFSAPDLGRRPEEMISEIVIHGGMAGPGMGLSQDGFTQLASGGVTYGPMLSREIEAHLPNVNAKWSPDGSTVTLYENEAPRYFAELFSAARAGGADIERWLNARAVICLCGPMSEAKYLGRPYDEVLREHGAENDISEIIKNSRAAGLKDDEIHAVVEIGMARVEAMLSAPRVWHAVRALADSLPAAGHVAGVKVARIIRNAMGRADQNVRDISSS
jgi:hypothetical protein